MANPDLVCPLCGYTFGQVLVRRPGLPASTAVDIPPLGVPVCCTRCGTLSRTVPGGLLEQCTPDEVEQLRRDPTFNDQVARLRNENVGQYLTIFGTDINAQLRPGTQSSDVQLLLTFPMDRDKSGGSVMQHTISMADVELLGELLDHIRRRYREGSI